MRLKKDTIPKKIKSKERKVGMDIFSKYISGRPIEILFNMKDDFPPAYEAKNRPQTTSSAFYWLSTGGPRNRPSQPSSVLRNELQPSSLIVVQSKNKPRPDPQNPLPKI